MRIFLNLRRISSEVMVPNPLRHFSNTHTPMASPFPFHIFQVPTKERPYAMIIHGDGQYSECPHPMYACRTANDKYAIIDFFSSEQVQSLTNSGTKYYDNHVTFAGYINFD